MPFDPPGRAVVLKKRPKRYGWHRRYNADDTHPRWRVVAARSGAHLTHVLCVKNYLNDRAAEARKHGNVGDFDIDVCAAALEMPATEVADVFRVLIDVEWISRSHVITEWLDTQPELEDPTAAQRQQRKRNRTEAINRIKSGVGTEDDYALLSAQERALYARFAAMSRVTATPAPQADPRPIVPFKPIVAKEETHAAHEIADRENDRAARRWLLGDGTQLGTVGTAATIVAQNYKCARHSADEMIRAWLPAMLQEAGALALIISETYDRGMAGENFKAVIEQRITVFVEERTKGPKLPFGLTAQNGRRR